MGRRTPEHITRLIGLDLSCSHGSMGELAEDELNSVGCYNTPSEAQQIAMSYKFNTNWQLECRELIMSPSRLSGIRSTKLFRRR